MITALLVLLVALYLVWTVLWILGGTLGELFKIFILFACPKRMKAAFGSAHGLGKRIAPGVSFGGSSGGVARKRPRVRREGRSAFRSESGAPHRRRVSRGC